MPLARRASNYTYVEASWTQSLPDWIGAHVRMLEFFGGVPEQIVSDNLKSGVTKACFHEPQFNRTYADMAAHYDTALAIVLGPMADKGSLPHAPTSPVTRPRPRSGS